jgi:hypothetical protein
MAAAGIGKLVASDGLDEVVGSSPRFAHGGVLLPEFLSVMGGGAGWDNWICRRLGSWDDK